ncbi:MAG: SMC-Scp complex subunit ScpB [Candidatus Melainabacteria bacterium]|nr:SMC-Scp complex subunit ScpB [Candidatus Melainabacteria bacterium]
MDKPIKAKVEAALFLTENPLKAQAVATMIGEDVNVVRQTILELIREYEERQGGLEISDDNGYIIQVKDEYSTLVDEFVPLDMPTALIRTLSAIAIKQPVAQSEIIKIRGQGAYEHIKELTERDLVNKREDGGRSPILTTTKKFQEYFRLSKDGKSLRQLLGDSEKESGEIFDASPDPDGEPIGSPAEATDAEYQPPDDESKTVSEPENDARDHQPEAEDGATEDLGTESSGIERQSEPGSEPGSEFESEAEAEKVVEGVEFFDARPTGEMAVLKNPNPDLA